MHEVLAPLERHAIAVMRVATLRGMAALSCFDIFGLQYQALAAQVVGLKTELIDA
jgi:hypothetical protein